MEENNKLIAEFMGCTHPFNEVTDATLYNVSHGTFELSDLRYDSSWDWLMPVIDKIDDKILDNPKLDCSEKMKDIAIKNDFMDIRYKFANIEEVYYTVVEFIKEYNNGKN